MQVVPIARADLSFGHYKHWLDVWKPQAQKQPPFGQENGHVFVHGMGWQMCCVGLIMLAVMAICGTSNTTQISSRGLAGNAMMHAKLTIYAK